MVDVVWLIPALPLAGFLCILLFGRRLGDPKAGYFATAMVGASFFVTVGVFLDLMSKTAEERRHVKTLFEWVPVAGKSIDLAFLADPLSITMCLFVTGIGSLIHLYAVGYHARFGCDFPRSPVTSTGQTPVLFVDRLKVISMYSRKSLHFAGSLPRKSF